MKFSGQTLQFFSTYKCRNLSYQNKKYEFISISVTNNTQEYGFSTLYANEVQSNIQDITPNLERENASNKRNSGGPASSEVLLGKEHITNDNQVAKCSSATKYNICSDDTPDILVNKLHQTIVEMKKCDDEAFKKEYSVSRCKI